MLLSAYAKSGSEPAYGCAMCGTELAYGGTDCYAMSGTEIAYDSTLPTGSSRRNTQQVLSAYRMDARY
eukprot:2765678-Rhodomonas_salina.1